MANEKYQTIKVSKETHRELRILAALTGESMLQLIDRLVKEERRKKNGKTSKQGGEQ